VLSDVDISRFHCILLRPTSPWDLQPAEAPGLGFESNARWDDMAHVANSAVFDVKHWAMCED